MASRIPRFESHIRHMIRRLDHERMAFKMDLWNYDDVVSHADVIIERISADNNRMPPIDHGGPWPEEWVNLFKRWKDLKFPRLEIPTTGVTYDVVRVSSSALTLTAKGPAPKLGYAAWLEPSFGNEPPMTFSLFLEPPEKVPPFGNPDFDASIDFKDNGATSLVVNGMTVAIPKSSGGSPPLEA